MALLVLLATATGTRIITTDFRRLALNLLRLGLSRHSTMTHHDLPLGRASWLLDTLRIFLASDLHGKEFLDNVFLHPLRELFEHHKRLFLVLLQWILLSVPTQANAFLKVIHCQQMILPQGVDSLEQDHFLQVTQHRRRKGTFSLVVHFQSFRTNEVGQG